MLGTIPPEVLVSPNIAGRPLLPPPPFASFLSFLSSFLRLRLSRLDEEEEEEEEDLEAGAHTRPLLSST
jgi:hypothetical protein